MPGPWEPEKCGPRSSMVGSPWCHQDSSCCKTASPGHQQKAPSGTNSGIGESEQGPPCSVLDSAAREWEAGDQEHLTLPLCLLPETPQRDLDPGRRAAHQQADPPTYPPGAAPHLEEDPKLLVDGNTQSRTSSLPLDWNNPEVPTGPALLINSASS